jgi:hypothetical protein
MAALAEALRAQPVTVVELAAELGEDADHLAWRLAADVRRDATGFRCVPAEVAKQQIAAKLHADETARLTRERAAEQQAEQAARVNAEREAMLAGIDKLNARFPGDPSAPASALFYRAELEAQAMDELALLDEEAMKARTARRYDEHGRLIDANGNVISP